MKSKTQRKNKFSFWILLGKLTVSLFIFIFFSIYVWGIQLKYETLKVGWERAFFYSLLIFGASFSYDCAKKILFLDQSTFIPFVKKFGESAFDLIIFILFGIGSAFFISIDYTVAGQLCYIAAIAWELFLINSISKAIETVTN